MERQGTVGVGEMEEELLLGEVRALARRMTGEGGMPGVVGMAGSSGGLARPVPWAERAARYVEEVVVREEWPVVLEAWTLAAAGRHRELVVLDRAWGERVGLRDWAEASLRVGQRQLNRLRPLRDARVVQRYLAAIESNQAHGWHPVVYGVVLAVFGLPLRQGLIHYADTVLGGLLEGRGSGIEEAAETERVLGAVRASLPGALARCLPATGPGVVR